MMVRDGTLSGAFLRSVLLILLLSGCTTSYPYLFLTNDCRCENYTFKDPRNKVEIEFSAEYRVGERVTTSVEIQFRNNSRDTLSLQQAFIKGTSRNIRYQYNDKAIPLPFITIPPQHEYTVLFEGTDTEIVPDPWLKIAGERTSIEIKGLLLGGKILAPVNVELAPVNPKLAN